MSAAAITGTTFGNSTSVRSPRARTAETRTRIRVNRRGRVVLTTLAAAPLIAFAAFFMLNGGGAIATSDATSVSFEYVTVSSGESLWDIAESVAPNADPRDVVSEIMSLNQLQTSSISAGQRLAIPTQYTSGE